MHVNPQLPPDLLALFQQLLSLGAGGPGGANTLNQKGFAQLLQGELDALSEAERSALLAAPGVPTGAPMVLSGGRPLPLGAAGVATDASRGGSALLTDLNRLNAHLQTPGQGGGLTLAALAAVGAGAPGGADANGGGAGGGTGQGAGGDLFALWAQQRMGGGAPPGPIQGLMPGSGSMPGSIQGSGLGLGVEGGFAETLDGSLARQGPDSWSALQGRPANTAPATPTPLSREMPGAFAWTLDSQVGSSAWKGEVAQRVAWLAGREVQQAELRLNPPDLGPLKVSISVSRDDASIVFGSQHGAVRDAVEAALPRLREMMEASGLNLVQVDVSHQEREQTPDRDPEGEAPVGGRQPDGEFEPETGLAVERTRVGLVDAFV